MIKSTIEKIRKSLNQLVLSEEICLCNGKVLEVSQELDKLISAYYKERLEN